ncbi:YncE family protein [Streptomyces sp. NPDC085665]|uniref:YncE family protein n=1 Tax=Streptomyces sp. NPDC085665 TaxID=3365735 RepID=UPI0037D62190
MSAPRASRGGARRPAPALAAAGAALLALLAGCAAGGGGPSAAEGPGAAATARVGPSAVAAGVPTAHGTLLVADFGGSTVTFVDPARGRVGSVEVGTAPYGLAVGADGRAWVATAEGVAVVDTTTRTGLGRIPYRTRSGPVTTGEYRGGGMGIALSPDGRRLYVGVNVPGGPGVLEVIDTGSRTVTAAVPVGRRPFDVDVAADGSVVYATGHDSYDVTAVRADTLAARRLVVAPYGERGLGSWLKPHYAVVRPSDGRLLLPFEGEKLAVLDPGTGRVTVEPMTADIHQHGAALAPDGTLLVVGAAEDEDGASLTVRSPGGAERTVPLDGPHEDVAVSADGRTAYVTGGFTRDGYWDGITVVDLPSGTTRRLPAGQRPLGIAVL